MKQGENMEKVFLEYIKERLSVLECFYEDIEIRHCKECHICKSATKVIKGEIKQMKRDIKFLEKRKRK